MYNFIDLDKHSLLTIRIALKDHLAKGNMYNEDHREYVEDLVVYITDAIDSYNRRLENDDN